MMEMLKGIFWVLAFLAATAALVAELAALLPSVSTAPPGGVSIYVDPATGCEYLSRRGLTPRLDGQGRHMGCRP